MSIDTSATINTKCSVNRVHVALYMVQLPTHKKGRVWLVRLHNTGVYSPRTPLQPYLPGTSTGLHQVTDQPTDRRAQTKASTVHGQTCVWAANVARKHEHISKINRYKQHKLTDTPVAERRGVICTKIGRNPHYNTRYKLPPEPQPTQ